MDVTALLQAGAEAIERARAASRQARALKSVSRFRLLPSPIITDAALCGDCIARKGHETRAYVESWIRVVAGSTKVMSSIGECPACRTQTVVHRTA